MKHRAITFTPALYPKVQDGTKDVTRRMADLNKVNENPDDWTVIYSGEGYWTFTCKHDGKILRIKSRYGVAGDLLYVKEAWMKNPLPTGWPYFYKADADEDFTKPEYEKWKSPMFMPKSAARLWLEVVSIRPERLQDITEEDAIREGIEPLRHKMVGDCWRKYGKLEQGQAPYTLRPINSFESLWDSIYGEGAWESNPWVWRVEFRVTDKPGV